LERRLHEVEEEKRACNKKLRRDRKIKDKKVIKTYNFPRRTVKNHRNGKTAPLDEVLYKGRLDLLHD
jgi:protein subunit release factor A